MLLGWVALWGHSIQSEKKILKKARNLVLSALVSSEAKNDILQFAENEFASEPLISSSIHLEQGEDTQVENFLELNVEKTKCTLGTNTINRVRNLLLVRKLNCWNKINHLRQATKISSLTGGDNWRIWDVKGSLFVLLMEPANHHREKPV